MILGGGVPATAERADFQLSGRIFQRKVAKTPRHNENWKTLCVSTTGNSQLVRDEFLWIITAMSAQEIIEEFKALPPAERAQVTKFVVEHDDSWIPDEFKEAMKDAEAGRLVDMETALHETPPPRLR
jgi:hypothetical protein